MAPLAIDIARLRRMTNEPEEDTYMDEDLSAVIARYPVLDAAGNEPWVWSVTYPPTQVANPLWIEGYDLHAAASEVWEEKASIVAQDYDFTAPLDDGAYRRSQVYMQYMAQARWHNSRRAVGVIRQVTEPRPIPSVYGNINNPYE